MSVEPRNDGGVAVPARATRASHRAARRLGHSASIANAAAYDVLPTLEFNAVHSGDAIARVYFAEAARLIRHLRSEADHFRRCHQEEIAINHRINRDASRLESELAKAIETQRAMTEGHGPKDESAVGNADLPNAEGEPPTPHPRETKP